MYQRTESVRRELWEQVIHNFPNDLDNGTECSLSKLMIHNGKELGVGFAT